MPTWAGLNATKKTTGIFFTVCVAAAVQGVVMVMTMSTLLLMK